MSDKATDENIIKEFLTKMVTQNNRGTAMPFYYVIRTKVQVPAHIGCGYSMFLDRDNENTYDSEDAFIEDWKEDESYNEMSQSDKNTFDEKARKYIYANLEELYFEDEWQEQGMFLTETDAENHLKANHYHYSDDAHTYVQHAWRAPEFESFFLALINHFKIKGK